VNVSNGVRTVRTGDERALWMTAWIDACTARDAMAREQM